MSFIKKVEEKLKLYQEFPSDFLKYNDKNAEFIKEEIQNKLDFFKKLIDKCNKDDVALKNLMPTILATLIGVSSFSSDKKSILESCLNILAELLKEKQSSAISNMLTADYDQYIRLIESFSFKFPKLIVLQKENMIDLRQYPQKKSLNPDKEITCEVPKGNTLKLVHDLIAFNVIEVHHDHYKEIAQILNKNSEDLKKEDIETFDEIISKIKVNPREGVLRLTGQLLATSALSNDYFMLKTIDLLLHHSINLEMAESKNMKDFMSNYKKGYLKKNNLRILTNSSGSFSESRSFFWLKFIIEKNWVNYKNISDMIERLPATIVQDNKEENLNNSSPSLHFSYSGGNNLESSHIPDEGNMPKLTKKF